VSPPGSVAQVLMSLVFLCSASALWGQVPVETALDTTGLTWTTGGSAPWFGQTAISHDGVDAVRSGAIGDYSESWLQTTLAGPGTIAFWWRASSEGDADLLQFYAGSTVMSTISGGVNWQRAAFHISAGTQTLKWTYSKDGGANSGLDAAFLDEVAFAPDSGPPVLLVQPPPSLTVITGLTATLKVVAGGDQGLTYQWWFNETNLLVGATGATLTLNNLAPENTGYYQVVVTNASCSVTSAPTLIVATNLGPVTSALLLVDGSSASAFQTAITQLTIPFQRFTDEASFAIAVDAADPTSVLAIVDSYTLMQNQSSLVSFVQAGGRAILQYWSLTQGSRLASAFGAAFVQPLSSAISLYDWSAGLLYSGLVSPIGFTDLFYSDGMRLHPGGGAAALAGFTSNATANQAGVLVANQNRTLLNGFLMEEVSSTANAVQLARNEISYLTTLPGPPQITAQPHDRTVVVGATATFSVAASGKPAPAYLWLFNDTNVVAGATIALLSISGAGPSHAGSYCAVVTNVYGAVTSNPALLAVVDSAPVQNTLLFVDGTQQNVFQTALTQRGQPYQRFNDVNAFSAALATANPASTLAIADVTYSYPDLTEFANFTSAGGRSILEYWNLANGPVAIAFGVGVAQTVTAPPPLYSWGGTGVFAGLPSQVSLSDYYNYDGTMLQPLSGATAVAGYTAAPTANQAAIVLGSNNRTFVNGFLGEDVTTASQAVKIAANEIGLLCNDPAILVQPKNQMVFSGRSAFFSVTALGTAPLSYQWRKEGSDLPSATQAYLGLSNVQPGDEGQYQVIISNAVGSLTSSIATLTQTNRIPGAVAWWTGDGDSFDIIGTNHGALLSGARFTPGIVGQAFWFDGIDDQFSAPTAGFPVGTSDRTIELWTKLDSFNSGGESFVAGYGQFGLNNAAYALTIPTSDKQIYWSQWGQAIGGGGALKTNVWYHIAVSSSAGFTRLYLNGSEVANGRLTFSTTPSTRFYLGFLDASRRLRGAIDEVTVHNRALSADEIMAIYSAGNAGKPRPSRVLNCWLSTTNTAVLTWEGLAGVKLQRSDEPAGAAWQDVPGSESASSMVLPVTNNQSFFRLTR
jgi:hypothetical protein